MLKRYNSFFFCLTLTVVYYTIKIGDGMKKNYGFTLIELLATISLLAFLAFLIFPNVTERFENSKKEISDAELKLIYNGAKNYILDGNYSIKVGKKYCITLDELNSGNYISIDTSKYKQNGVQVTIGSDNNYSYKMVNDCD